MFKLRDENCPKKPPSTYTLFVQLENEKRSKDDGLSFKEFQLSLAKKWEAIKNSTAAKDIAYMNRINEIVSRIKAQYKEDMATYTKPSVGNLRVDNLMRKYVKLLEKQDPEYPSFPKNGYMLYCIDRRPKLQESFTGSLAEMTKVVSKEWNEHREKNDEVYNRFTAMAVESSKEYKKKMETYRQKSVDELEEIARANLSVRQFNDLLKKKPVWL
jgi:hypothetical protein